jgi:chromosome segregation ATPase
MKRRIAMTENTSNNQPPVDERLSRIENTIMEFTTGQQQILSLLGLVVTRLESIETDLGSVRARLDSIETDLAIVKTDLGSVKTDVAVLKLEMAEVKDDAKLRYVDLRERIILNNDHLGVLDRPLRQLVKDLRQPLFPSADTR